MNVKIAFVNDVPTTIVPATLYVVKDSDPSKAKMYASPSAGGPLREISGGSSGSQILETQWNYLSVRTNTFAQVNDFIEVTSVGVTITLPSNPQANSKVRVISRHSDTVVKTDNENDIQTVNNKVAVINLPNLVVEFSYSGPIWYFST